MGRYLLRRYIRQRGVRGLMGPVGWVCMSVCVVGGSPGIFWGCIYKRGALLVICGHVQGVARDAILPQSCATRVLPLEAQLRGS